MASQAGVVRSSPALRRLEIFAPLVPRVPPARAPLRGGTDRRLPVTVFRGYPALARARFAFLVLAVVYYVNVERWSSGLWLRS